MGTQTEPLQLRLFLEGVEVPVIAASVNIQPGQPAQASIQIIPTDSALLMLPRTLVHLFFLDERPNATDFDPDAGQSENVLTTRYRGELPDARYKIMFTGEIIGYQYTKQSTSRSLVLQCMDLSSYWDTCYQWFADYSVNGNGLTDRTHHFVGSNQFLFNNITSGTRWVIGNILSSRPENPRYQGTRGLLAGYIHLLESIGGIRPNGADFEGFRGANDFFSIAELRYKLTGMIGAVANDTTAAQMYQAKSFRNWLQNGMGSAGSLVSFRDVLRLVGQYIYHDVYPNPAAYFSRGDGTTVSVRTPRSYKVSKFGEKTTKLLIKVRDNLNVTRTNYRNARGSISEAEGKNRIETASKDIAEAIALVANTNSNDRNKVRIQLVRALDLISTADRSRRSFEKPAGEGTFNIDPSQSAIVSRRLQEALEAVRALINDSSSTKTVIKSSEVPSSDFFFNQLILPETYFVPPPKCNVIFPDQYNQFTYSRNFIREVSRLALQAGTGIIGSKSLNKILGRHYFAPNIEDVRGKLARTSVFTAGNTLMPHEVHTGIVPKFEWVTDGQRWGLKAARAAGETRRESRISYIQRMANFQFFLHRWSARTMNLNGKFMPNLVLGFPSVVIDRGTASPAALTAIADTLGSGRSVFPTAYIGKISGLVHTVDQNGGNTQVSYKFARTHRGFDDEFLGVLKRERKDIQEIRVELTFETIAQRLTSGTAVTDLEKKLAQLYFAGELIEGKAVDPDRTITKVTPSNQDEDATISRSTARLLGISDSVFDLYLVRGGAFNNQETGQQEALVPPFIFVDFLVKLSGNRFVSPEGAPPPEVILKPGWYSQVWNPVKRSGDGSIESYPISDEVYRPLLGTFAITDDEYLSSAAEFAQLFRVYSRESGDEKSVVLEENSDGGQVLKIGDKEIASFDTQTQTVEQAVDGLTILYGMLRARGLSTGDFVKDYTRRPIASMIDLLGEPDLTFDENGDPAPRDDGTIPIEGFHTRAYGDYNANVEYTAEGEPVPGEGALRLLLKPGEADKYVSTIFDKSKKNQEDTIPAYLDPRGRAQDRVRAYAAELNVTRGLLGA